MNGVAEVVVVLEPIVRRESLSGLRLCEARRLLLFEEVPAASTAAVFLFLHDGRKRRFSVWSSIGEGFLGTSFGRKRLHGKIFLFRGAAALLEGRAEIRAAGLSELLTALPRRSFAIFLRGRKIVSRQRHRQRLIPELITLGLSRHVLHEASPALLVRVLGLSQPGCVLIPAVVLKVLRAAAELLLPRTL